MCGAIPLRFWFAFPYSSQISAFSKWQKFSFFFFFSWTSNVIWLFTQYFSLKHMNFVNFLGVSNQVIYRWTWLSLNCSKKIISRYNEIVHLIAIKSKKTRTLRPDAFFSLRPWRPLEVIIIPASISIVPDGLQSTSHILFHSRKKNAYSIRSIPERK